ncbi:ArsR/SmtB family transcription factor [Hymenobacter latericus]|uniref:ArsR/SmtB family transcription factor n=1 Tax=Hymenobacter sp. YIM 151858-1 TaxID=2987688 RepID=UPI002226ECA2|nr:metalloregulator ArsR/SmtB family transcription factor [Hymenobacter sp. YIM 151858-1]UYZ60847.1 metalloregulator ArsR/SmtB family transcription factor [Hymenobacter sp. YIM 151858-1]
MTYAKLSGFTEAQRQLARVAKALSHPARIAIIELLAAKKSCISGDIAAELPLSRTTVSQHLQELKAAGLIRGDIDGLTVCYCLDTDTLSRVQQHFGAFLQQAACCNTTDASAGCAC